MSIDLRDSLMVFDVPQIGDVLFWLRLLAIV
jgi:hypothetical protein